MTAIEHGTAGAYGTVDGRGIARVAPAAGPGEGADG